MSTTCPLYRFLFAIVLVVIGAGPAAAQVDASGDIRRELAELRAEIQQLRDELHAIRDVRTRDRAPVLLRSALATAPLIRSAPGLPSSLDGADRDAETPRADVPLRLPPVAALQETVSQASLELLQTQVAELSQVKVESTSRMPVKLFGTIHTNAFWNSGTPNWLDSPNLVNPTPADGADGSFSTSLRQTRLGFTMDGPTLNTVRTTAALVMDFFGGVPGFATGQVMGLPRLLVAYARLETDKTALHLGQDHMILAPVDPTSLASFAFPALFRSGNLYLRTPQVRVERALTPALRVMGGIVAPIGGDLVGEAYRFVAPALGGERSQRPGFQARVALATAARDATRHLNLGIAGHHGWERRGAVRVESSAAALDFAMRRDVIGAAGELFVGENIDAFGGAVGLDARARGGWAELQVHPTQRLSFAAGAGVDEIRGERRLLLVRQRNRSAYGTALFTLTPEIQISFEYHRLATMPGTGAERRNHHFDWVMVYNF